MSTIEASQNWEKESPRITHSDCPSYISTRCVHIIRTFLFIIPFSPLLERKLEAALNKASKRALEYDRKMRGLEVCLVRYLVTKCIQIRHRRNSQRVSATSERLMDSFRSRTLACRCVCVYLVASTFAHSTIRLAKHSPCPTGASNTSTPH
jgi:hypothetical protein